MTLRRLLLFSSACAPLICTIHTHAQATELPPADYPSNLRWRIGARVGANINVLSAPTDPVGEPTLLYGSSLSGLGFLVGPTVHYRISDLNPSYMANAPTTWGFTVGALYGHHSGMGFARNETNGQEQALTLASHMLHVPVLFELEHKLGELGARVGLGPELLWTIASSADVEYTNINTQAPNIKTANTLHIGATATAGVVFDLGEYRMPVMLRATWDPQVPGNTRERFGGDVDEQNPGDLQVAFDWQYALVFGLDF